MRDLPLSVGDTLAGFCDGHFGRDSYCDKDVEAIGRDWVVAREFDGRLVFAVVDPAELVQHREYAP